MLIRNISFNYLGTAVVSIISFILFPYILGHLGNEVNGIWQLIASLTAYFGLLELGITASITKFIAESAHSKEDSLPIVRNAFFLFAVIGVVSLILGLALLPFIDGLFHISGALAHQANIAYVIILLTISLTFPSAIFVATFAGFQEYNVYNYFVIGQALLNALGIVLVLHFGYSIIGLAAQSLLLAVVMFFAQLIAVKRRYGITLGGFSAIDTALMRRIFAFSKWVFLMNIAIQIVFNTDNIVLGVFASLSAITFYQVALKPNNFLRTISGQLLTVVMPASSQLKAREDTDRIGRLLLEASRITSVVLMPFLIVFIAWGHDFIRLWVGPGYESAYPALIALSIGIFATSLAGASSQILLALNRPSFLAKLALAEAGVNLVASILLVKPFGILGVAIGTTAPTFITALIVAVPYAARLSSISPWLLYRKMIEPMFIGAVFALGAIAFNHAFPFQNFFGFILASAVLFAVYVSFTILIDGRERHIYVGLFRKMVGR